MGSLVKAGELPSAANAFLEQGPTQRGALANREEDSSDEEEDLQSHPWTRQELRDKAVAAVAKRKKHRKTDAPGQQSTTQGNAGHAEQPRLEAEVTAPNAGAVAAGGVGDAGG